VLADIKHSENIGMIERGHCPRLLLETTQSIGFAGKRLGKNLQRNIAPEARIFCAIYFSHAAGTEWSDDFVGS